MTIVATQGATRTTTPVSMPTMPLNSSQPQRSFFWIWRTAATKLKAPLTKENAPNTKVMANRADCGIQNARAAKINAKTPRNAKIHQFSVNEHSVLVGSSALESVMVSVFMLYLLKI
ncbi:hypothetical protein PO78_4410 [Thauera sp. SWB20]|nr:hypothetical protein PO78_4410 [Thauera sp. SWB20]